MSERVLPERCANRSASSSDKIEADYRRARGLIRKELERVKFENAAHLAAKQQDSLMGRTCFALTAS